MSNESKECREKGTATEDELKKGQDSVEADAEDSPSKEKEPEQTQGTEENKEEEPAEKEKKEPEEDESTRYMRLMADFQNYKKRVEKEKSDIYSYANEKLVTELLNVLDNFERALEHEGEDKSFHEGMQMIFKQLFDVLEKSGLKEIPALGEEFDPNFHNAVMNEDTEEYESGTVSGVMQKGYTLNGKVIRPSMVKVAS